MQLRGTEVHTPHPILTRSQVGAQPMRDGLVLKSRTARLLCKFTAYDTNKVELGVVVEGYPLSTYVRRKTSGSSLDCCRYRLKVMYALTWRVSPVLRFSSELSFLSTPRPDLRTTVRERDSWKRKTHLSQSIARTVGAAAPPRE